MMKSMDELREEIRILKQNHIDTDELIRIADAIEQEIDSDYMRLPRDKDGVPIHVGDEMACDLPSGKQIRRCVKYVSQNGFAGYETHPTNGNPLGEYLAGLHCHYKPPTVEKVLREFANLVRNEGLEQSQISDETIAEYAARLQLKEEQ